jgi:succinate dehydrogenase / fumarate reductase, iron-sulfur subunit
MEITLSVCRFDPDQDSGPFFQDFKVTVKSTQTVLDALMLAWQQDPTLSFRRSCRSAICGSCAMRINTRPALACQTLIATGVENRETIVLEPLPHFRQLKDLVVDFDPFFESLKSAVPWIVLRDDYNGCMAPEVARELEDPATCILCGVCHAEFDDAGDIKPAGVIKTLRFARDPRDALGAHRLRLLDVPPEILRLFIRNLPDACPKGIRMKEDSVGDARDTDKRMGPV